MVHNVERSVLFSSGRVYAELSRLGFALASLGETEYAALASCETGMHAVCLRFARFARSDTPVRCTGSGWPVAVDQQGAQGGPHQQVQAG